MGKGGLILVFMMLLGSSACFGQQLSLGNSISTQAQAFSLSSQPSSNSFAASSLFTTDSTSFALQRWRMGYQILPSYARENPSGYSFLCRLELKAEDKLPIGLWFRADDGKESMVPAFPQTYVQFKLLRF